MHDSQGDNCKGEGSGRFLPGFGQGKGGRAGFVWLGEEPGRWVGGDLGGRRRQQGAADDRMVHAGSGKGQGGGDRNQSG